MNFEIAVTSSEGTTQPIFKSTDFEVVITSPKPILEAFESTVPKITIKDYCNIGGIISIVIIALIVACVVVMNSGEENSKDSLG